MIRLTRPQALALARGYGNTRLWPTYGDINECTRGIVFFGTPHRTKTSLGWHSVLNRIRAASQPGTGLDDLSLTPPSSGPKPPFMRLLHEFEESLDDGHITIYSCFENHETPTDRLAALVRKS
jgi:hypothetical protein